MLTQTLLDHVDEYVRNTTGASSPFRIPKFCMRGVWMKNELMNKMLTLKL